MANTSTITIPRSKVIVRKLWLDELPAYRDFLVHLDEATRRNRFCGTVSDSFVAHYSEQTWAKGALVIGAFSETRLCGVAELHPAGANRASEAAFVVKAEYRNQGIGTSLVEAVLLAATNRGYRRVETVCLPTNVAMRQLARRAGARVELAVDELKGEMTPSRPTFLTWMREALGDILDTPSYLWQACARG